MFFMVWLVLCTSANYQLIQIPWVLVIFMAIVWLIMDICTIVKFWEVMDRLPCRRNDSKLGG